MEKATQILRIISRSVPTDSQEERLRDLQGAIDDEFGIARSSDAGDAIQALLPLGTFSNPAFFDPDRIEQAGGLRGIAGGSNITGANTERSAGISEPREFARLEPRAFQGLRPIGPARGPPPGPPSRAPAVSRRGS